jgi:mannose-6-phosphate isomerase-like protein (cupin superfamily)
MKIFNLQNSKNTGSLGILKSYLLIGNNNVKNTRISLQISYIPVNSEQPIHQHEPEQCYYIIRGKGLMTIDDEQEIVNPGDAIYIGSNQMHGIKNTSNEILEYLTANAPAFDVGYENQLWTDV